MEPNAKKSKPNGPTQTEELQLSDLNDDCIRHILWRLPPADLCSMSFTCRRMKELAFDHFPRQYPDERVTIQISDECKTAHFFNKKKTAKHLKYFAKCIRNVRIVSLGTDENFQDLFDFVNNECSVDWRSLQLSINGLVKSENVQVIKNRLENLLSLSIHHPHSRLHIHDVLLKHCKKIEYFEINSNNEDVMSAIWMMYKYPTIKSIHIDLYEEDENIIPVSRFVDTFLRLNPQITNIECWGINETKFIWHHIKNIERITLHLYCGDDVQVLLDHFRNCCKERRLAWLGLDMQPDKNTEIVYQNLETVNALQPIHSLQLFLGKVINEPKLISKLKSLVQLQLSVPFEYSQEKELLHALSRHLPNLQDLRLNLDSTKIIFKDVTTQFVRYSLKMRNLNFTFCYPNTFTFHPNDLVKLNNLRWSIGCTTPMTIRLGYRETYEGPPFNYAATLVVKLQFTTHEDLKLWYFS